MHGDYDMEGAIALRKKIEEQLNAGQRGLFGELLTIDVALGSATAYSAALRNELIGLSLGIGGLVVFLLILAYMLLAKHLFTEVEEGDNGTSGDPPASA